MSLSIRSLTVSIAVSDAFFSCGVEPVGIGSVAVVMASPTVHSTWLATVIEQRGVGSGTHPRERLPAQCRY